MIRKNIIIAGILLLVITFVACQKEENSDLFEQQPEELLIAEDQDTQQDTVTEEKKNVIPEGIYPEQVSEGDVMAIIQQKELQLFYYEEISDAIKARINGISYGETCEVPYDELRYVKVIHFGFDGQTHSGELIVNKSIAEDIVAIFQELYELEYPIEQMVLVDEYDADDNTSMAANNTSAFNYRKVDGTDRISIHSYGLAIDINPRYNPYVRTRDGETVVTPDNGVKYADRTLECDYYISSEDPCYLAFTKRGFLWGGEWKNQKDYQHFYKELK